MRVRLPLLIACVLVAGLSVRPAAAIRYMTDEEAYVYALGEGVELTAEPKVIDEPLAHKLSEFSGLAVVPGETVTVEVGRKDGTLVGFAMLLSEKTRYRPITFVIGINAKGEVLKTGVVVYREPRGEQVTSERFNEQYKGKTASDEIRVGTSIRAVSGATVSAEVMTAGVKKALLLVNEWYLKKESSAKKDAVRPGASPS